VKGPVTFTPVAIETNHLAAPEQIGPARRPGVAPHSRRWLWRRAAVLVASAAVLSIVVSLFPMAGPQVMGGSPITHTGSPKYAPIISAGNDISFTEVNFGQYRVVKINQTTHETSIVPTNFGARQN